MFRTTGAFTTNESSSGIKVWGGIREGMAAQVVVPSGYGANDTITGNVYTSTDDSTYVLVSKWAKGTAQKPGTTGFVMIIPFPVRPGKQYIKLELLATAASTTETFGTVVAGIIPNPGYEFDRTGHWE
jgi:hypothetical protein